MVCNEEERPGLSAGLVLPDTSEVEGYVLKSPIATMLRCQSTHLGPRQAITSDYLTELNRHEVNAWEINQNQQVKHKRHA